MAHKCAPWTSRILLWKSTWWRTSAPRERAELPIRGVWAHLCVQMVSIKRTRPFTRTHSSPNGRTHFPRQEPGTRILGRVRNNMWRYIVSQLLRTCIVGWGNIFLCFDLARKMRGTKKKMVPRDNAPHTMYGLWFFVRTKVLGIYWWISAQKNVSSWSSWYAPRQKSQEVQGSSPCCVLISVSLLRPIRGYVSRNLESADASFGWLGVKRKRLVESCEECPVRLHIRYLALSGSLHLSSIGSQITKDFCL
jgi:hypothetical protein